MLQTASSDSPHIAAVRTSPMVGHDHQQKRIVFRAVQGSGAPYTCWSIGDFP